MKKINNKYDFFAMFSRFILLGFLGVLSACSNPNNPQNYMKTFDHILTDQFIWGGGGIYWISNEQVVLEAHIKDEKGELDRGLYQVDVRDGSYTKIVEVPDKAPITYKYCFDGETLHVMRSRGVFTQTNPASGFQVEIRELGKLNGHNDYSALRCRFVDIPYEVKARFIPLKTENGFLKKQTGVTKDDPVKVILTDDQGASLKEIAQLPPESSGVIGLRRFVPHLNAYFGHTAFNKYCTHISWLYRKGWKLEQETLCLRELGTDRIFVHSIKNGFYLEQYNVRSSPSYIFQEKKPVMVEDGIGRGASVSPDGCRIAYGAGDSKRENSGVRQKLKLFNYCDYLQKGQKS